ncbi:TGF-beta-activated kinase 1 and MAP3K7-binding protein 1 isoform X1 [Carassius auratus]|uniref:TGF-beta-activated kinase 1 and MAP3K7-binding protein 1 n=1 Tax=Carassius auratus TaxID=7957 RepID=A0A6P6NTN5_CARAU|nr:TGF-beta-activated kinase 1 and MAP3K7-binding protein 1-like isoform X1 [Carassius auratus]
MAAHRSSLMQSHQSWTDDLPLCQLCGVGSAPNCVYGPDGQGTQSHPNEDGHFCFSTESCFLYGVFNGFDGSRVASFVSQRLTAELLLGQLSTGHTDADVARILSQAFDVVEKSYFETIDDALAEKANLQTQLPEGVYPSAQTQKIAERLKTLEQEVSGGATAIVALILNDKLYIANVGTNRALLCKTTTDGQNQVIQIGRAHTPDNEDELSRLAQLGLDPVRLRQTGLISGQSSTRRIGDYKVKFNYTDIDVLSAAKQKPIISEPEIHGGQSLEGVMGFLLLMSEGLIKALESAHGPEQVNQEIVAMVAAELAQQSSLEAAAQSVVERVKRLHHDVHVSGRQRASHCSRHEDMTLLIRVINYTLADGLLTPTQGGRIYPVSVPYSNHQSTSKTSVMLSLVMPAQGTLTNGSSTASTLEGDTPTAGPLTALIPLTIDTSQPISPGPAPPSDPAPLCVCAPPLSQSPTATLQSSTTHTQSSSSSSGDGSLFRQRGSQAAQPDETGPVPPYVDFTQFYRLWGSDHSEGQGLSGDLGPQ